MTDVAKLKSTPLIDKIFAEIKGFEELMRTYRDYGAADSEPDGVFQRLLDSAIAGNGPAIPRTGTGWDLYASQMDCEPAAHALHDHALKIVQLIESCPIREMPILKSRLKDYCWRLY